MAGFVLLHRKSIKSQVFANEGLWKTWTWCLMRANHKECFVTVRTGRGTTEVKLSPGQFIFGRRSAGKSLRAAQATIEGRMKKLARLGNISLQAGRHFTIVTVCKWATYQKRHKKPSHQAGNQPSTNHPPTIHQPGTDNNVEQQCLNNVEQGKRAFRPPSADDVSAYCLERSNGIDAEQFIDHYTARGWKLNRGLPMKDWKAAVRTWERNDLHKKPKESKVPTQADLDRWNPIDGGLGG